MRHGSILPTRLLTGRRRFFFLLIFLITFIFMGPMLGSDEKDLSISDGLFTVVLLLSAYSASEKKAFLPLVLGILLPAVALIWVDHFHESTSLTVARNILSILFFSFIAGTILSYALRAEKVDFDKISAALCAYLLLGLVWALVYFLLEFLQPGTFLAGGQAIAKAGQDGSRASGLGKAVYFSFTTLTTLGYGDITGASQTARSLSVLEALIGQIYLVVLVARLVGLEIAHSEDKPSS